MTLLNSGDPAAHLLQVAGRAYVLAVEAEDGGLVPDRGGQGR